MLPCYCLNLFGLAQPVYIKWQSFETRVYVCSKSVEVMWALATFCCGYRYSCPSCVVHQKPECMSAVSLWRSCGHWLLSAVDTDTAVPAVWSIIIVVIAHSADIYTVSQKHMWHYYFYDNFGKRGPIFTIFSLLNSERLCGKGGSKTTTSPQICCHTTLRNVRGQV